MHSASIWDSRPQELWGGGGRPSSCQTLQQRGRWRQPQILKCRLWMMDTKMAKTDDIMFIQCGKSCGNSRNWSVLVSMSWFMSSRARSRKLSDDHLARLSNRKWKKTNYIINGLVDQKIERIKQMAVNFTSWSKMQVAASYMFFIPWFTCHPSITVTPQTPVVCTYIVSLGYFAGDELQVKHMASCKALQETRQEACVVQVLFSSTAPSNLFPFLSSFQRTVASVCTVQLCWEKMNKNILKIHVSSDRHLQILNIKGSGENKQRIHQEKSLALGAPDPFDPSVLSLTSAG